MWNLSKSTTKVRKKWQIWKSENLQKSVMLVTDTLSKPLVSSKTILLWCRFGDKNHFFTSSIKPMVCEVMSEIEVFWVTKWRRHLFYFIYYSFTYWKLKFKNFFFSGTIFRYVTQPFIALEGYIKVESEIESNHVNRRRDHLWSICTAVLYEKSKIPC